MLYCTVPKEIRDYDPKIFFGLSLRQLVWLLVALGLGVAVYFGGRRFLPEELLSYGVMAVTAIPFLVGFIPIHDMPADRWFQILWTWHTDGNRPLTFNLGKDGGGLYEDHSRQARRRRKKTAKARRLKHKKGGR